MCVKCNKVLDVKPEEKKVEPHAQPYKCGFCGSTNPLVEPEVMYGPGTEGMWPCCPDCGGV